MNPKMLFSIRWWSDFPFIQTKPKGVGKRQGALSAPVIQDTGKHLAYFCRGRYWIRYAGCRGLLQSRPQALKSSRSASEAQFFHSAFPGPLTLNLLSPGSNDRIEGIMIPPKEFIRKIRPFSFLTENELDTLMSGLEVELFRKDRIIYSRGESRKNVYMVYSGLVCLYDEEAVDYISQGETLGLITADSNEFLLSARAVEDTVCYLISVDRYKEVLAKNKTFSEFFSAVIARRFKSLKCTLYDDKILQESALVIDLERVIYRRPVVCKPHTLITDAAAQMDEKM